MCFRVTGKVLPKIHNLLPLCFRDLEARIGLDHSSVSMTPVMAPGGRPRRHEKGPAAEATRPFVEHALPSPASAREPAPDVGAQERDTRRDREDVQRAGHCCFPW